MPNFECWALPFQAFRFLLPDFFHKVLITMRQLKMWMKNYLRVYRIWLSKDKKYTWSMIFYILISWFCQKSLLDPCEICRKRFSCLYLAEFASFKAQFLHDEFNFDQFIFVFRNSFEVTCFVDLWNI